MDSHRLIYFAGQQGLDKQHNIVEELFLGYFTQGKYIGDRLELTLVNFIDLIAICLACCSGLVFYVVIFVFHMLDFFSKKCVFGYIRTKLGLKVFYPYRMQNAIDCCNACHLFSYRHWDL